MGQKKGYKQTIEHIQKRANTQKKGQYFYCIICNKEFWRKPYEIKMGNNKFCSKKCYFEWQKGKKKTIKNPFDKSGKNNPNFQN